MSQPPALTTVEIPVAGMDCAGCTRSVQQTLTALPGVASVDVLLSSEKAIIRLDPTRVDLPAIRAAVARAGYTVPEPQTTDAATASEPSAGFTRDVLRLLGIVFGAVLFIVVAGEWLGLFEQLTERVPFFLGLLIVVAFGYPVFRNVIQATLRRQVIAHTVMRSGSWQRLPWASGLPRRSSSSSCASGTTPSTSRPSVDAGRSRI